MLFIQNIYYTIDLRLLIKVCGGIFKIVSSMTLYVSFEQLREITMYIRNKIIIKISNSQYHIGIFIEINVFSLWHLLKDNRKITVILITVDRY